MYQTIKKEYNEIRPETTCKVSQTSFESEIKEITDKVNSLEENLDRLISHLTPVLNAVPVCTKEAEKLYRSADCSFTAFIVDLSVRLESITDKIQSANERCCL